MRYLLACLMLIAPAALAEERLITGEEFRRFAEGWSLHFEDRNGDHFGSEQYFSNGQSVWLPEGGQCERGVWAQDGPKICFLYAVGIACWLVYQDGDNLRAVAADEEDIDDPLELFLTKRDKTPVICPEGPSV
ncbi:MAG: hypothetical protein AAF401_07295 [Pseudomonadota bacterium]